MSELKTILFLSTDATSGGEQRWAKEGEEIREALSKRGKGEEYEYISRYAVDTKRLQMSLLQLEPYVVHLAGPSDDQGILFENRNKDIVPVEPAVLANLISIFEDHLTWVVLSGCYNRQQAEAISQHIDHVIGLDHALSPQERIRASSAIYEVLVSGREDPVTIAKLCQSALELEGGNKEHIHLFRRGTKVNLDEESAKPAGVSIPALPEISTMVGHTKAYFCNRSSQNQEFSAAYEDQSRQFYFFGIHGNDPQSHHGLFTRFYHNYLFDDYEPDITPRYKVVLQQAETLEKYKAEIRSKLLTSMNLGRLLRLPNNHEMTGVARKMSSRNIETVAVEFRVRSSHWKKFTPELLKWFTTEFCQLQEDIPDAPVFYFFLSIIYESEVDHMVNLPDIKKIVTNLPGCAVLQELSPVSKQDILSWIDTHITSNSLRREQLFERYFPEGRSAYDMAEVELRLDTIIQHEPSETSH